MAKTKGRSGGGWSWDQMREDLANALAGPGAADEAPAPTYSPAVPRSPEGPGMRPPYQTEFYREPSPLERPPRLGVDYIPGNPNYSPFTAGRPQTPDPGMLAYIRAVMSHAFNLRK